MSGTAGTLGWGALGASGEAAAGTETAVGVGAAGLGEGAVAGALASNPIGWTILGVAAAGLAGYGLYKLYDHVAHNNAEDEANKRTNAPPAVTACTSCAQAAQGDPKDLCPKIGSDITNTRDELVKRYNDMREDKYDLYQLFLKDPTARIPNVGNWAGHVVQFEAKQANLQKNLAYSRILQCGNSPDDASKWSSIDPPSQPAPK